MSDNFVIGSAPIGTSTPCLLSFHEFTIYDSATWNVHGTIAFNNNTKNFDLIPTPTSSGILFYDASAKTYSTHNFTPGTLGGNVLYNVSTGDFYTS